MTSDSRVSRFRPTEAALGRAVLLVTGIILVLTVLTVLVRPHNANIEYARLGVLAGVGASLVLALALTELARRRVRPRTRGPTTRHPGVIWLVATGTSVLGGAVGVLLALPLRYDYGWDAAVVTRFSEQLTSERALSSYAQDYLSRYPNNVRLVAMMNVARRIGGPSDEGMYDAYLVANGLFLAAVLLLSFGLVRMFRGSAVAFVAQAVVFVLIGCSPWMAVPYTDLPAMAFVTGAVVLGVAATRSRRIGRRAGLVAAACASVAIAFAIKSTPGSTAAAFVMSGLIVALGQSRRALIRLAMVGAVGGAAFALTAMATLAAADRVAQVPRTALDSSRTAPVTWWLANGLSTTRSISGRPYYGAYNPQMVKESMGLSGERLHAWSEQRLTRQLEAMGATGVVAFEVRKQAFNWGDGMFFAWGEGYDFQASRLQEHDWLAKGVQSVQHPSGSNYVLRASLTNGLWLALLLWAGTGLLRARYSRELLVVVLTVLGIAAFTLLFQGRSRYLFAYAPIVVGLAAVVRPLPTALSRASWRLLSRRAQPNETPATSDASHARSARA